MNRIVIDNGTLVNEGRRFNGYIVIEGDRHRPYRRGRYPGAQAEIEAGTEVEQQRGRKQALPPASRPA